MSFGRLFCGAELQPGEIGSSEYNVIENSWAALNDGSIEKSPVAQKMDKMRLC